MLYLRQHNVIHTERSSRGYVDCFLAIGSEVKRDSTLPLSLIEDGIHDLECDHLAVHFQSQLLTDLTRVNNISLQNKFPSQHVCREFLKWGGEQRTSWNLLPDIVLPSSSSTR